MQIHFLGYNFPITFKKEETNLNAVSRLGLLNAIKRVTGSHQSIQTQAAQKSRGSCREKHQVPYKRGHMQFTLMSEIQGHMFHKKTILLFKFCAAWCFLNIVISSLWSGFYSWWVFLHLTSYLY